MTIWWDNSHLSRELAEFRTRHQPPAPFTDLNLQAYAGMSAAQWRRMAAVHEAGHAVAGIRYGLPLERMVLGADYLDSGRGFTRFRTSARVLAWHYGLMCVAGERATLAWLRDSGQYTPEQGWVAEALSRDDRSNLQEISRRYGVLVTFGEGGLLDWADLSDEVDQVLAGAWRQVEGLAAALDTFCDLDGSTVAGILADIEESETPFPSPTAIGLGGVVPPVWGGGPPSPRVSTDGLSVEATTPATSGEQAPVPAERRTHHRFSRWLNRRRTR